MSLRNTPRPAALVGVLSILFLAFSAAPKAEAQQTCDFVAGSCQSPIDVCPSESELETGLTCTGGLKCCAPSACVDRGGACVAGVSACPAETTFLGTPADCSGTTGRCCTPPPAPTPTPTPVVCNNDTTCQPGEPCSCADCNSAPQCQGGSSAYKVEFLHTDALGSVRMVTDQTGAVVSRSDYYPFGSKIDAGINGRVAVDETYADDPALRQRFTGKERDGESQLDYFGARYYSASMGRFASVDPASRLKQRARDPQMWNHYAYARSNPLRFVDPNGEWPTPIHNAIIDRAFPSLSSAARGQLIDVSARVDLGQMVSQVHGHFMKAPAESAGRGRLASQSLIGSLEASARARFQEHNLFTMYPEKVPTQFSGLDDFGRALHAVTDGTSPAHVDDQGNPQSWSGIPFPGTKAWKAFEAHEAQEATISPEQMDAAVAAARASFGRAFGDTALQAAIKKQAEEKERNEE